MESPEINQSQGKMLDKPIVSMVGFGLLSLVKRGIPVIQQLFSRKWQ